MQQLSKTGYSKLKMCFAPESAAIIGASTDPMKFGGRALKFCLERNYGGRLYPVNAKNDIVQGVHAFGHISDIPETPDIAVIAVPAPLVRENLEAAGKKGCGIAIVYGAQFAEAGEGGRKRQDELLEIARSHDMRLIGPNCMGVISLASGFVASFTSAPEHHDGNGWPEPGNISVASQSGAVGIQMFSQLRDRGLGLANWISTGNQADIDVADAIAYFAGDPETAVIAVYMEDASRGLKLVQALEMARRAKKPVVVLKVGTTPHGGVAAAGHTASMYVEDRMVDDIFTQYGVLRAGSVNELIDLVAACNARIMPDSNKVAAVSVSGGGAVMIADAAAEHGLDLVDYPAKALAELKEANVFVNDRNPIDISAPSMSNMEITGGHLKWGLERGQPSMIGYISHVPLVPRTRSGIMPQLLGFREAHPDQFIAIAANMHDEDRKALVRSGVAVFDDPTIATRAVGKLVQSGVAHRKKHSDPSAQGEVEDANKLLAQAGIPIVEEWPVASAEEAVAAAADARIVLKLSAPGLVHRTEIGGVLAGLAGADAVRAGYEELARIRDARTEEWPGMAIIASPFINGVEVLAGVRRDPHFGPLVVLGSGGIDTEIHNDVTYRKAPIGIDEAAAMVDSIRVAPKLAGWRGFPAVDRSSLEQAITSLSEIAHRLPSLEINPLFATADGVMAADLVLAQTERKNG